MQTLSSGYQIPELTPSGSGGQALVTNFNILDNRLPNQNYFATVDPTVDDDESEGYFAGSKWLNQTSGKWFICFDSAPGAAVWKDQSVSVPLGVAFGNVPVGTVVYRPIFDTGIIAGWTLVANASGSASIQVARATYSTFPTPTTLITPALSSAQKNSASGLTLPINSGDIMIFTLASLSGINNLTLALDFRKY